MITEMLNVAEMAAREAGEYLRAHCGNDVGVLGSLGKDIKTRADLQAEAIILGRLRSASAIPVLAEESGSAFSELGTQPVWIVDPLDGTLNQSRAIPLACVSIGLWQGDNPLLGVVYDFHRDELFSGAPGRGATCNKRTIFVSETARRADGVLCTGFPSFRDYSDAALLPFVREVQSWKKVRLLGSAALSLAWVAAGRVDAYAEDDIQLWDVAAGLPLVLAAGGRVDCFPGTGDWRRKVWAGNRKLS
jgi:myo-inositol-1(or 4)-monophosphatase